MGFIEEFETFQDVEFKRSFPRSTGFHWTWGFETELSGPVLNIPTHGDSSLNSGAHCDPLNQKFMKLGEIKGLSNYYEWSAGPFDADIFLPETRQMFKESGIIHTVGNVNGGVHVTFGSGMSGNFLFALYLYNAMIQIYPMEVLKQRFSDYGNPFKFRFETRKALNVKVSIGCTQTACWPATSDYIEILYMVFISHYALKDGTSRVFRDVEAPFLLSPEKLLSFTLKEVIDKNISGESQRWIARYKLYRKEKEEFMIAWEKKEALTEKEAV